MNLLLIISQVCGLVLLVGLTALLFFRRVYLDARTEAPIEFKIPILGILKTQSPVLALAFIAAIMIILPIRYAQPSKIPLVGKIETPGKSIQAVVVATPDYTHSQDGPGPFKINVTQLTTDATYRVKFIVDRQIIDDQQATLKDGAFILDHDVSWSPPADEDTRDDIPVKREISDEELRKLGL